MICCLCTAENPCGPTCLALPAEVRRRNMRPRWWQLRRWVRRWSGSISFTTPTVRWYQPWRWWLLLVPRYWRTRSLKFPVIRNPGTALKIDDMVAAQPMTAKVTDSIAWIAANRPDVARRYAETPINHELYRRISLTDPPQDADA